MRLKKCMVFWRQKTLSLSISVFFFRRFSAYIFPYFPFLCSASPLFMHIEIYKESVIGMRVLNVYSTLKDIFAYR